MVHLSLEETMKQNKMNALRSEAHQTRIEKYTKTRQDKTERNRVFIFFRKSYKEKSFFASYSSYSSFIWYLIVKHLKRKENIDFCEDGHIIYGSFILFLFIKQSTMMEKEGRLLLPSKKPLHL